MGRESQRQIKSQRLPSDLVKDATDLTSKGWTEIIEEALREWVESRKRRQQ